MTETEKRVIIPYNKEVEDYIVKIYAEYIGKKLFEEIKREYLNKSKDMS